MDAGDEYVAPAPVLEMLWEACDPEQALRTRFGLDDAAMAARWVVQVVEARWGVRVRSCDRIVLSAHNALAWLTTPSGPMLVKWSVAADQLTRLAALARLTHWLDERGLPVSPLILSTDGVPQIEVDGVSIGLQRALAGDLLDVDDTHQVRAAGSVLARLHEALATYPDTGRLAAPPAPPAPPPLPDRLMEWADTAGEHVPAGVRDTLRRLVDGSPAEALPTQLVHGDVRSANLLCRGPAVVAVLDLEETRLDHCVVELARAAVLLGTRFHDWAPVPAEVGATLRSGYESVRPLTRIETRWWDAVVLWQAWTMVPAGDDPHGWRASAEGHLRRVSRRHPGRPSAPR